MVQIAMRAPAKTATAFVVHQPCPCFFKMGAEALTIPFTVCRARVRWLFPWAGALVLELCSLKPMRVSASDL